MSIKISKLLPVTGMFLATLLNAGSLWAQNELGSSPEAHKYFSKDYDKALDLAFPNYRDADLKVRFEEMAKKYPNGLETIKARDLVTLAKMIGVQPGPVRPGQMEMENANMSMNINYAKGKAYYYLNQETLPAKTPAQAKEELELSRRLHMKVLSDVGLRPEDMFFADSSFMFLQSSSNPVLGDAKTTTPVVDSTFTYVLRSLDKVMVEGSYAKVFTKDPKTLGTMDVRWPRFLFHPELKRFDLKTREELKKEILTHLRVAAGGQEVSVRMAVVLRPVMLNGTPFFVPALKIGLAPQGGGEGEVFYANLPKQAVKFDEENQTDRGNN